MMGRFLIYFSYIGTKYSGVQQQVDALTGGKLVKTVAGVLENALQALRPVNPCRIQVSSRTDRGVHALRNTCHIDLEHPDEGVDYDPAVITNVANFNLLRMGEDVRVVETRQVADNFHSRRNALGRKYVYRLAHVVKPGSSVLQAGQDDSQNNLLEKLKRYRVRAKHPKLPVGNLTPCLDIDKIYVHRNKLDINKLTQAAGLLSGIHDYTSFSNKDRSKGVARPPHPVKLLTIGIKRGRPFGDELLGCGSELALAESLEYWDIHVHSKSFLYKMVRRCVGGMILAARDAISLSDLKNILDNPTRDFPFTSAMSFSEKGLFLVDVEYSQKDLDYSNTLRKELNTDPAQSAINSITSAVDSCIDLSMEPGLLLNKNSENVNIESGSCISRNESQLAHSSECSISPDVEVCAGDGLNSCEVQSHKLGGSESKDS